MDEINDWLKDKHKDYGTGLKLYSSSSVARNRTLAALQRGSTPKNLSILIKELRQLKNSTRPVVVPRTKPAPVIEVKTVQSELEKASLIHNSTQNQLKKIRLGDLPKELRPKYKKLSDLWYQMCELKFVFNELPPKNEKQALQIILKIEALDQEKDMIWKELDHWQKFKTILPQETEEDFSKLSPQELFLKKANLGNYIHKKNTRIDKWKEELLKETKKPERVKIQEQINRTLKSIHEHELNLNKIGELI